MAFVTYYARVSDTKIREDGLRRQDIERQKEALSKRVSEWVNGREGWTIAPPFVDDGISASGNARQLRPAFQKLIGEIKSNRVKAVFVEDLTRLTRDPLEFLISWKLFAENNCHLFSLKDGGEIDLSDPAEKLMKTIIVAVGAYAETLRGEKVSEGMKKALTDGRRKPCVSCGVPHIGRHPNKCLCELCRKKLRDSL